MPTFFLFLMLSVTIISCTDADIEDIEKASIVTPAATGFSEPTVTVKPTSTAFPMPTNIPVPTAFPSPSLEPTPCAPFCAKVLWSTTPLPSPKNYLLKQWTVEDAQDVMAILDTRWAYFVAENDYWIYGMMVVNRERLYTALLAQETILRFPDYNHLDELKWQAAYDLAVAGEPEASNRIAELLEYTLNQQNNLQEPDVSNLWQNGFSGELIPAQNLFGDNLQSWILKVGKQYEGMPLMQLDGATLAIRKFDDGRFNVLPVNSFWMPWHGDTYEVSVGDHTADFIPEITVATAIHAGTGSAFRSAALCIYQWHENEWIPLLKNALNEPCFHYSSLLPWDYIPAIEDSADTLDIIADVHGDCYWHKHSYFGWDGNSYHLDRTHIDIPDEFTTNDGFEMLCLEDVWEWAVIEKEFTGIINLMENLLDNWPELEESLASSWYGDYIGFDSAYKDFFRFQLGRFYALSGNEVKATEILSDVVDDPYDVNKHDWPSAAQNYLNNLRDLEQAEQVLAESMQSIEPSSGPAPRSLWAGDVGRQAATSLFSGDNPMGVITFLQSALNDPDFQCYGDSCAHFYYLMGLAYELSGDKVNAVTTYWQLWNDFPESPHAIIVQNKLTPMP